MTPKLLNADWNYWPEGRSADSIWESSAKSGFDGIELPVYDPAGQLSDERVATYQRLAQQHDLPVGTVLAWARPQRGADHPRQSTAIQRLTFAVPGGKMAVVIALRDMRDVDHWLSSPKRDEIYRPLDITEVMASEVGSEATRYDGVHAHSASRSWTRSQGLRLPVPPRPNGGFAS
jgi:hypothetical protein